MQSKIIFWSGCVGAIMLGVTIADAFSVLDRIRFRRPESIVFPNHAPYSPQIAALGKILFFEPRIFSDGSTSCATCHNPSHGWVKPLAAVSDIEEQEKERSVTTILNLAEAPVLGWDGRYGSLEELIQDTIITHEHHASIEHVIARIESIHYYERWFRRLFPERGMSQETISIAIATFIRTMRSGTDAFDRWVNGDKSALSNSAQRGFKIFIGKGGCERCHSGWNFTDYKFHNTGIGTQDRGAGEITPGMDYKFKTPSLRGVAIRGPYMHDNSLNSLDEVIRYYSFDVDNVDRPGLEIRPVFLSDTEIKDLTEFLNALTPEDFQVSLPLLPSN